MPLLFSPLVTPVTGNIESRQRNCVPFMSPVSTDMPIDRLTPDNWRVTRGLGEFGKGDRKALTFSYEKKSSGAAMYNTMTIVNNTLLYV